MKPTAGSTRLRPVSAPPRRVRLDLKRRPKPPEPEEEIEAAQRSAFWKWFLIVAFLHVVVILTVGIFYALSPAPKPPEEMISLLPPGETVKGTPGEQRAHKVGPTTAASIAHHAPAPTSASSVKPAPIKPPTPTPSAPPTPIVKNDASALTAEKPVKPPPKPKVKVDLHLADAPATLQEKPKHHVKKPTKNPDDTEKADENDSTAKTTTTGLSKEQIAEKLGEKLDAAGIKNATKTGTSGSDHSKASEFSGFYAAIHDEVMQKWTVPNQLDASAVDPVVMIHVERDGRVPPESVYLQRSSGNAAYDESAVSAAKSLGYLHEPLPEGCPPDISITFKPNQ